MIIRAVLYSTNLYCIYLSVDCKSDIFMKKGTLRLQVPSPGQYTETDGIDGAFTGTTYGMISLEVCKQICQEEYKEECTVLVFFPRAGRCILRSLKANGEWDGENYKPTMEHGLTAGICMYIFIIVTCKIYICSFP